MENEALCRLRKAPTIDPESLRAKGRWEESPKFPSVVRCSECKDMYLSKVQLDAFKWAYCPNCGARMEVTP